MPTAAPSTCRCGGIKRNGLCDRCGVRKGNHKRTTKQRGYGHDWRKLSKAYRRANPLCEDCKRIGKVSAATSVHHRAKFVNKPELRLDWDNLVSLCDSCHSKRTRQGE